MTTRLNRRYFLKRTALTLDVDEPTTAAVIEVAYAAGLLAGWRFF